ncbi:hypothetical protein B7P43_G15592 [Cryptotermes secundus]|uniref:Mitotic checkpoint serine/threonine-protein kinase BUB1 n=1 Tax=Cryptotermes secundus TaxID=105785 RepID=A0A2J7PH44_9NEOP|nr:uncharacterized protein LOC111874026 isoform X2 [Cryptotermes secundus]PNF15654.1 hypothetical protein B7P43_G15592 [Cryptotermes secundus]
MVDPGEEVDLMKENIQPLKKGRIVCQLGTALLAQDDSEARHEILKQREKYEVLLRSYEGNDPIEPWYEYILWVEQSFLRDGREGNLNILLQRCLTHFKEDERYFQDRRYIELWIKYIEMSKDPLEVYKTCHSHGIGKYSAFFYVAWAFELEKAGDIKRANQVFSEGIKNCAQPRDELEEAHKNFQLRVARHVLNGKLEAEDVCTEQRVALNKLKAHGHKKNLVGNVRIGDHIQRGPPGILQPINRQGNHSSNAQAGSIKVLTDFQDEDNIGAEFAVLEGFHLSGVPQKDIVTKENTLKPGPWSSRPHRTHKAAVPLSRPQQPSFELHRDEELNVPNSPLVICNALKPRKLDEDGFKCSIAVFEPEDPTKRPMYCKNKVYAGGTEFSFEELRAIEYLKYNRSAQCNQAGNLRLEVYDQEDEPRFPIAVFEPPDPTKRPMYCKSKVYSGGTEFSFEELRAFEYLKSNRPSLHKETCTDEQGADNEPTVAKLYGEELHKIKVFEAADTETKKTDLPVARDTEKQQLNLYVDSNIPAAPFSLHVDAENKEEVVSGQVPPVMGTVCLDRLMGKQSNWMRNDDKIDSVITALSEALPKLSHTNPSLVADSSSPNTKMSNESCDQSLCHQSLTYHTKEAMKIMHELWTTPEDKKLQYNRHHIDGFGSKKRILPFENVGAQCLDTEQPRVEVKPFEIFKDESNIQGQGRNDVFYAPRPEGRITQFEVFRGETEVMQQVQNSSDSLSDPAKCKLEAGWILRDNPQAPNRERGDNEMFKPTKVTDENCPPSYFRDDNSPDFRTDQPWGSEIETCNCENNLNSQSAPCSHIKIIVNAPVQPGIPFIPSPGMSEEEEKALEGTEDKENVLPEGVLPLRCEKRKIEGILQPSGAFPCSPEDDPAAEEEFVEPETYYNNVTCNTQAFSHPLLASTPFVGQAKQSEARNTAASAECSVKTGHSQSDQVIAGRSAKSAAHTVENLSTIMETTECCRSSGSSSSSGATTRHTAMFSQENYTTGSMKRSENGCKSSRHSEQKYVITETWRGHPSIQETHRQSSQCLGDNFMVKRTSQSLYYKMETVSHTNNCVMDQPNLPEEPSPSENAYRDESVKSVLQKDPDRHNESGGNRRSQQIRGMNSGYLKNYTGLDPKLKDNETLLKNGEVLLLHAKTKDPDDIRETESDSQACKNKLSRVQGNCLAEVSKIQLDEHKVVDPFDHTLIQQLLTTLGFPNAESGKCCVNLNVQVPQFKIGGTVILGKEKFKIENVLGEGSYAKVFKATDVETQRTVALKVQKPSWEWEFYICHQIQSRLSDSVSAMAFMDVHMAYMLKNGSVLVTDYSHYGSLLSVIVKLRQQWQSVPESLMLYWMVELLSIVEKLQECRIIHGDIKPDNFVLRTLPSFESKEPSLQLIDMGRGIDMTLFPEGTTFNTVVTTKDFQCIEMQTKRPWTYQTDLYGIAGTMHCVYFSQYMKVRKQRDGRWFIQQSISRYSKRHLWEQFFSALLNVESCENLPNLAQLRSLVEAEILTIDRFSVLAPVRRILGDKSKQYVN